MKTVFYTSRGREVFLMLFIAYLIIFAPVIAFLIDPSGLNINSNSNWYFAIFPISIFLFFLYVITASFLKMFIKFSISSKGITIYKPPFHRKLFKAEDIEELLYLNQEETKKLIHDSIKEQEGYKESVDIIGFINMIKEKSPAFKYYTNTASAEVTTVGPKERITSLNLNSGGECILLKLKNGETFYLTPSKPEEFKKCIDTVLN